MCTYVLLLTYVHHLARQASGQQAQPAHHAADTDISHRAAQCSEERSAVLALQQRRDHAWRGLRRQSGGDRGGGRLWRRLWWGRLGPVLSSTGFQTLSRVP